MWQVVSTSVSTTPASKSTPVKPSTSRTPASTPSTHATGSSHRYDNRYVQPSIIPLTILSAATVRVAGRISLFVEESARLTKDPWVLFTVANGFRLEFSADPPFQHNAPSNASKDASQLALCSTEVEVLTEKGAIVEANGEDGYISRYFLIPKKGVNNWRPIINLKPLNQFLLCRHFKMEGINTVRHTVRQGEFLAKVDLTDAYFTIPIYKDHRKYLRFRWNQKTFEYTCLPFGFNASPWVFTKLLRVAVTFLR